MQAGAAAIAGASRFLIREAIITTSPMLVSLAKLIRNYESGREDMVEYMANNDAQAQEKIIGKQFNDVCFICEKVLSTYEGQRSLTTAMYMLEQHRRKMGETYQRYVDMEAVSMITTRYKNGRVSKEPEYPNGELYFDHCVYGFLLDLMRAAEHIRFKHTQPQDPAVLSIYHDYLNDAVELQYSNPNPQIMFSNWSRVKTKQYEQCVNAPHNQSDALSEGDESTCGEEMLDDEESTDADDCQTNRVLHSDPNSKHPFVLLSDISSRQVLSNKAITAPSSSHVAHPTAFKAPAAPQIGDMFGLWFPASQVFCGETNLGDNSPLRSCGDQAMKINQHQALSTAAGFVFPAQCSRDKQASCQVSDSEDCPPPFALQGTPCAWFENDQQEELVSLGTLTPSTLSPAVRCESPCRLPSSQELLPPAQEATYALSQGSMFGSCPHNVVSATIPD